MSERRATVERTTSETAITARLRLDGDGRAEVRTGIGFLDHMLTALAKHGWMDLSLECTGDLHIDDHHTAEDCAIALGRALDQCLGTREGIARFGFAYAPLDEALARAVVDLSGRGHAEIDLGLTREAIGGLACENIPHLLATLATNARATVHIDVLCGTNDHHRAEAAFKALALALRQAVAFTGRSGSPSTKGVL